MGKVITVLFDLGNVLAFIDFDAFWRSLGFLHPGELPRSLRDINRGHTGMKPDLFQRSNTWRDFNLFLEVAFMPNKLSMHLKILYWNLFMG